MGVYGLHGLKENGKMEGKEIVWCTEGLMEELKCW